MITNTGIAYAAHTFTIGENSNRPTGSGFYREVENQLVGGIPTRLSLTVREVPTDVRLLALVEFVSSEQGVRFRNISVE
jgi:hypothetical protein